MANVFWSCLHLLLQLVAADGNCFLQLSASSAAAGGIKWQLMATFSLHLSASSFAAGGS
jgi:hypothetical protein